MVRLLTHGERTKFSQLINWLLKYDIWRIGNDSKVLIYGCFNTKNSFILTVEGDDENIIFYEDIIL